MPSRLVHPLAAVILPVSLSIFLSLVLSICLCRSQRWRHRRCRLHQDREQFVEVDPSGRLGRYSDLLGAGAVKKVYRGFDQEEGRDVAWNQVKLRSFSGDPSVLKRLFESKSGQMEDAGTNGRSPVDKWKSQGQMDKSNHSKPTRSQGQMEEPGTNVLIDRRWTNGRARDKWTNHNRFFDSIFHVTLVVFHTVKNSVYGGAKNL
ncbi:hypothetical protein LXL04_001935 [Taraxacum kok-saghyz]